MVAKLMHFKHLASQYQKTKVLMGLSNFKALNFIVVVCLKKPVVFIVNVVCRFKLKIKIRGSLWWKTLAEIWVINWQQIIKLPERGNKKTFHSLSSHSGTELLFLYK